MADWEPEFFNDECSTRKINRRIEVKYPGSDVSVSSEDVVEARKAAFEFLEKQAGPGTDGLNLQKGAFIQYWPPSARGLFSIEVGNDSVQFGTVKPMTREFSKNFQASKDPVWVEATVGRRLELRNERLGMKCERTGRIRQSGQRETSFEFQIPKEQQHGTVFQERPQQSCH